MNEGESGVNLVMKVPAGRRGIQHDGMVEKGRALIGFLFG